MTLTNLEQAIVNVLSTKRVPDYNNVFDAYTGISRLPLETLGTEGPSYFDRAIGKYRAAGEKGESPFAEYVANIRKQCMIQRIDIISSYTPLHSHHFMCPCLCGEALTMDQIRRKLELIKDQDAKEMVPLDPPTKSKKPKSRRSAKAKKIKKHTRELAFDPYAPSTSTVQQPL